MYLVYHPISVIGLIENMCKVYRPKTFIFNFIFIFDLKNKILFFLVPPPPKYP